MPIEIRELLIKATLSNENDTRGDEGAGDREAIIAECVEQVMEILKAKTER